MPALTLKSLPPGLHRQLKSRAVRNKRSLNMEVIAVLEEAVAPARRIDTEALIAEAQQFRSSLPMKTTAAEIDRLKREGRC